MKNKILNPEEIGFFALGIEALSGPKTIPGVAPAIDAPPADRCHASWQERSNQPPPQEAWRPW